MIIRSLNILKSNSFFLFGARATGKTTLVNQLFPNNLALSINLLDTSLYARLQAYPAELRTLAEPALNADKWIIIDEVQKVPALLDIVHDLIERRQAKFGLTGSSARKLRRGASNLLAGRAFTYRLFPLTPDELGERFNLENALTWGTLPQIYQFEDDPSRYRYLQSYVETYLQEEIVAEQIVRKLPPFRRFLQIAAQTNGEIINYTRIAKDIDSDPVSVKSYFQILEDTLIGFFLEPFHRSIRKRQRKSPKFYLFDPGVIRAQAYQLDIPVRSGTYSFGRLFETFLVNVIRASLDYQGRQYQLSYLCTKDGAEIDLIVERGGEKPLLIEIKSAERIYETDIANLTHLAADVPEGRPMCLCRCTTAQRIKDVDVLPWRQGLEEIGIVLRKS